MGKVVACFVPFLRHLLGITLWCFSFFKHKSKRKEVVNSFGISVQLFTWLSNF